MEDVGSDSKHSVDVGDAAGTVHGVLSGPHSRVATNSIHHGLRRALVFFVHPGSTSTSNLLRLYADALDLIEHRAREDRVRRRDEWKQNRGKAEGGKGQAASNPFAGGLLPFFFVFAAYMHPENNFHVFLL